MISSISFKRIAIDSQVFIECRAALLWFVDGGRPKTPNGLNGRKGSAICSASLFSVWKPISVSLNRWTNQMTSAEQLPRSVLSVSVSLPLSLYFQIIKRTSCANPRCSSTTDRPNVRYGSLIVSRNSNSNPNLESKFGFCARSAEWPCVYRPWPPRQMLALSVLFHCAALFAHPGNRPAGRHGAPN